MDLVELFHERAAIYEFDAGLPRAEAERKAYWELRKQVGPSVPMPDEIRRIVRIVKPEKAVESVDF